MGETFLSIVIPAYNEETRILATLKKIMDYCASRGYKYEVIVVDDGSTDSTASMVKDYSHANKAPIRLLESHGNKGKGHAVRMGVSASGGECILFSDADLSTPIEEVEKLLPHLRESYDIAIGSRALNESQLLIHQPWYREMMGKTFNLLVQMLVMRGLRDTQCGFKIFKAETAREVFGKARINRFAFDVELLFIARKLGMRIKDVPVVWMHSRHSKVHILRDSLHMLTDLFRIKFYCLIGCYGKRFSVGERG